MKYIALIPSYEPTDKLIKIVNDLKELNKFDIIVVNDGSSKEYNKYFSKIKKDVTYLSYEENHGKGYALKYAFNYIKDNYKDCVVVTLDSDGQHTAKDTLKLCDIVKDEDNTLLLGKRLRDKNIPFKSKFGNALTRLIYRIASGIDVYDTQTGLRAFKSDLLPFMLSIEGNRFEYEMNMLLQAPSNNITIKEEIIETIYENNNSGTHFNAIKDSFRIYKLLLGQMFRFIFSSFASFIVDYVLYTLLNIFTNQLVLSNIVARVFSSLFNFTMNRNIVFKDKKNVFIAILKYYLLAAFILLCNTLLLMLLSQVMNRYVAKLLVEVILFTISYFIQKRFIFR